jgi:oxalate decarboxylase/phosphoglucose isomerase-like protein (cupin superfamily)
MRRWFEETVPGLVKKHPGKVFECMQPAGSLIHVPRNWWHAVWNVEASVAVTHNYIARATFEETWADANAAAAEMETEEIEEFCAKYVSNHFGFDDLSTVREWCKAVMSYDVV